MATVASRNHSWTVLAAAGAAFVTLTVGGCGADPSDAQPQKRSFALQGKTLTVDADDAVVELVPGDGRNVEVTRRVDGWVVLGSGPRTTWTMSDGTLRLGLKCTALVSDCRAEHQITVPRGVAVQVKGDNGSVIASGFRTALKLSSGNGIVKVTDCSGPLDLRSDNGSIDATRISATSVTADADNGSVRLGLNAVPDLVNATSGNGRILIDLPGSDTSYAVSASAENGLLDVDVPNDDNSTHVLKARSDNGEVLVRTTN
jgi:hypothetical protein